MASASSCTESIAPSEFPLSSSEEDLTDKTDFTLQKCPLCRNKQKIFYCQQCIRNGNFAHSRQLDTSNERYLEKKLKLFNVQLQCSNVTSEVSSHLESKWRTETLKYQIKILRERNQLLKQHKEYVEKSLNNSITRLRSLQQNKTEACRLLSKLKRRVERVAEQSKEQQNKNKSVNNQLEITKAQLTGVVRGSTKQLLQYIFPIERNGYNSEEEGESFDTVHALADATQTAYVRGRWVYSDPDVHCEYRIGGALLPGAGDMTSFKLCATKDAKSGNAKNTQSFLVALSYTAQVVQVLAFYLGLKLPRRVSFLDFSGTVSENQQAKRLLALQRDILFICASQRVPLDRLRHSNPLARILALLEIESCDFGRNGPFDFHSELWSLEEPSEDQDQESSNPDESSSEDGDSGDSFNADWEAIVHPSRQEMASIESSHRTAVTEAPVSSSVVGGVVSSVTSLWKAWPWAK